VAGLSGKVAVGRAEPALRTASFNNQRAWERWLQAKHLSSPGIWLRLARKGSRRSSVTHAEALDSALCYGWIDGQIRSQSAETWLVKFTPRSPRSIWSKINRKKALALVRTGRMRAAGLAEIQRAKKDGRWGRAYDSPRTATVPPDFEAALARNPHAKAFFAALESRNRYAILWRLQTAKKAETRARRIVGFVSMLERGEKLHP